MGNGSDSLSGTLNNKLRIYSKVLSACTLFLIFAGGMVTSTGSGLAVPDWPLSYGMLFPPMVGGVFYEHGHRLIAGSVGFLTLVLAFWLSFKEQRVWVRKLGFFALFLVIAQGMLGGLTVLFLLPKQISISHAIMGQTFFCMTVIVAYTLSRERQLREMQSENGDWRLAKLCLVLILSVYVQLFFGALMRHSHAGLAIYDFPTMAGKWWPTFDEAMLANINAWREKHYLPMVNMSQVVYHFLHRLQAVVVFGMTALVAVKILKSKTSSCKAKKTVWFLLAVVVWQVTLGVLTVWTGKSPIITSLHVVSGALFLGLSVLLTLRVAPLSWQSRHATALEMASV